MESVDNTPASRLKAAIKAFENAGHKKLYQELPVIYKKHIKELSFYKQIQRMKDDKLLSDSALLYQVLKIIGRKYDSLFEDTSSDLQVSFYLNKINESLLEIRKYQDQKDLFLKDSELKKNTRASLITKIDRIFSITYLLEMCLKQNPYTASSNQYQSYFINDYNTQLFFYDSSEYSQLIRKSQLLFDSSSQDIFRKLFVLLFENYGNRKHLTLGKLFLELNATVQNSLNKQILGLFGINYLLITLTYDYIQGFYPGYPFYAEKEDYEIIKTGFKSLLSEYDKTYKFIKARIELDPAISIEVVKPGIEALWTAMFYIDGLFSLHISIWSNYKIYEENNWSEMSQDNQEKTILKLCKESLKYDLNNEDDRKKFINYFRNNLCGLQYLTPISKRQYERKTSEQLVKLKLPLPVKDEQIEFISKMHGYLEGLKQAYCSTNRNCI